MQRKCWLCGSNSLNLIKPARMPAVTDSAAFRITDAHYGYCGAVDICSSCGFQQCSESGNVLSFYQSMEDPGYEQSRGPRALQALKLLNHIRPYCPSGRLLDIGAGSGILVEQAIQLGYEAQGIEPSEWLVSRARERTIPVHHGVLPLDAIVPPFDVVTLVDVIEHVTAPLELLRNVRSAMKPGGIGLVVTPDVASVPARLMGSRWWHYRVAHVCYFTPDTLLRALDSAGFRPIRTFRPAWYFTVDYLLDRLAVYFSPLKHLRMKSTERLTIPLNLHDSIATIFSAK